ncbi:GntR family transcriptional regulator [Intestinibacillus massiliensis]|uniref:GntR family transcriptional regulator n=1 Tax=Intestinibacillus massiliensis TaxID=1871029 RepID=UPI000B36324A|nr:GntR family transcriptional regulator [Intestinibacillus massiliensis]MCB6365554.1 GntR family transcriptional regulator [Intestinibacillus massiliensis]
MLHIDYRDGRPIYEQVADSFERMAICGALAPDSQLPSVRQLAMELSINPNTIQRAYGELEKRGVVYSVKGKGNFISADCVTLRERRLQELETEITVRAKEARELGADDQMLISWVIPTGIKEGKP